MEGSSKPVGWGLGVLGVPLGGEYGSTRIHRDYGCIGYPEKYSNGFGLLSGVSSLCGIWRR